MANIQVLSSLDAPELDVYARLTQAQLRNRLEPEKGVFIAESPKVIQTALDAGLSPVSFLMEQRHIGGDAAPLLARFPDIPVYTADVSGVCSALYELGGMTVMHDPSGCNSTYNTHDELRWYDQDSLIFISGLTEIDAVMGNDRKFIDDIEHAARELHPKFIALAGSPIPFMNGTDFPAIARVIEAETGIFTSAN